MSLSSSSGQKALQSPFSHAELYGVQHPLCAGASKESSSLPATAPVTRKPKASKRKKSTMKVPDCSAARAKAKPKSRKKGSTKVSSAPALLPIRNQTHKSSSPATFSLAQVDAGSPCGSRKPLRPKGNPVCRINCHKALPASSLVLVDAGSPGSGSKPTQLRGNSDVAKEGASLAKPGRQGEKQDHLTPSAGNSDVQPSMRPKAKKKETALLSSPISSLLTFSTLSTSDVVLRMGGSCLQPTTALSSCQQSSAALGTHVVDVRLKNKRMPSLHLPPHMRVHRQAFGTTSRQLGTFGQKKPLSLEEIARGLGRLQYQHIIVMSGAGVSTSSGIPDFRSPGIGLYDNLQHYNVPDPTAIFDIAYFSRQPKPFFALARELYPGRYQPNVAHHFVRLLQDKKLLLRNYTQNIDGLERLAGVQAGKLVEAHGSFSSASCIQCSTKHSVTDVKADILAEKIPRCKHKYCYGLVKPDIVFFGEDLPSRFYSLQLPDFSKCDLLIIMGTSLEVEPFASLVTRPAGSVPRLLLNRELVGPFKQKGRGRPTDVAATGDLVESVMSLARGAGWEAELRQLCGYGEEDESGGKEGEEGVKEEKAVDGVGVRQVKEEERSRWAKRREGGGEEEEGERWGEEEEGERWAKGREILGEEHSVSVFTTQPSEPVNGGVREKKSSSYQGVEGSSSQGVCKPASQTVSTLAQEELVLPLSELTLEERSQRSRRGNGAEEEV